MLIESLNEIKEKELYASIYADFDDANSFFFGKVSLLSDDYLIIESYSPNGQDGGFALIEVKSVYKIEINTKYSQKMMRLIYSNSTVHEKIDMKEANDNIVENLLLFSKLKRYIVSIVMSSNREMFMGLVDSIKNGLCCIKQINEYGEDDGAAYINTLDISGIACNREKGRYIKILNDTGSMI